jgi:hypothetical protein
MPVSEEVIGTGRNAESIAALTLQTSTKVFPPTGSRERL